MSELTSITNVGNSLSAGDALTWAERWAIRGHVLLTLTGVGIVVISQVGLAVAGPTVRDLCAILQGIAALFIATPLGISALRGLFASDADTYSDQLVFLAVLGALGAGEFITAALIPIIVNLGHHFEERGIQGSRAAIEGLRRLTSTSATVLEDGIERDLDVSRVRVGDVLVVRPGQMFAVDGRILEGKSSVDESMMTGESLPRDVEVDHDVLAGTVNLNGLVHLQVSAVGQQTSLGRIATLLAAAVASKPPIVRTLERYASLLIPTILLLGAVVFFVTRDLDRVVTVLIVSCPCALILSTPAAIVAALALASRQGVLIKNSKFLEALADARTVVFDKTGTITEGKLVVDSVEPGHDNDELDVWRWAKLCAQGSTHPVARAICDQPGPSPLATDAVAALPREFPGDGVQCTWEGQTVLLGRPRWLMDLGVELPDMPRHPGPVVGVARGGRFVGYLLLSDAIRPDASAAIAQLRQLEIERLVLLTGDRHEAAEAVAGGLGFDEIVAEQAPDDKYRFIRAECERSAGVIVVGDGANDALALAAGQVGIVMGARGSDVAMHSADIALMTNELLRIPMAIRLARRTRRLIAQNLAIGIASALLMLTLAATGLITPVIGAVVHHLGSVLVLANSGLMMRSEQRREKK